MSSNKNNETPDITRNQGDPSKFLRLIKRGYAVTLAKKMSGYSPNYSTSRLMRAKRTQDIINTQDNKVDSQRVQAQNAPGTSLIDGVDFMQSIRDDETIPPNYRMKADERIDKKLGYEAPTQIEQKNMSLSLDFHSDDIDKLQEIINQL